MKTIFIKIFNWVKTNLLLLAIITLLIIIIYRQEQKINAINLQLNTQQEKILSVKNSIESDIEDLDEKIFGRGRESLSRKLDEIIDDVSTGSSYSSHSITPQRKAVSIDWDAVIIKEKNALNK